MNNIGSIMGGIIGALSNANNVSTEEIKELKILTMNEVFNELKEKINRHNELSKDTERLGVNNSEVAKVEEEIKSLKAKIDELNSSIEGKSKIEKMKITLNVTSIESEISLKEMDLEEEKKKAEKDYDNRVQSSNKNLEDTKKELEEFIKNTEETLEKSVKNFLKKGEINNFKLTILQEKGLNNLGLLVSDLSGLTLSTYELSALVELSKYTKVDIENLSLPSTLKDATTTNNNIKFRLKRLLNRKNSKIIKSKLIEGTELEETKNYYDNIMKVELLNLENIEKEEAELNKKITPIKENIYQYDVLAKESKRQGSEEKFRRYSNLALDENEKIVTLEKEKEKLKIKKEAIENKINTINEMVDEMIKEVIKEELKKRGIVIPSFVPVTKYFNAPNEVEE
ncbi:hypothetical protein ACW0S0_03035 [Fusobacterium polymorphum]|jgi:hypothetical protein|uniref:hypothetical protein n=1 Tax=Fusobacterium nucleatum subsp. polymorphum TaxID=76857 RepID=UPI002B4BF9EF|nr:hypothetical protein [Fusobacterium polymorphum]WRL77194.1 hypothetical protein VKN79_09605 [Fusobacterium polymorphum]